MRFAPAIKTLKPSPTLAVSGQASALRAQGIDVLNMSLGEPDFPTPLSIRQAANAALEQGWTKYTPVPGLMEVRKAIATHLKEQWGYQYAASEVMLSTGAKQCLYNAISSLIGPGDEVIIPAPYWVSYTTQVELAGGTPVIVKSTIQDQFQIDPDAIEAAITPYTKMLILNSPNNPTGAVYTKERIEAIAQIVKKHGIWLLSDEIYNKLVYEGTKAISPLELDPSLKDQSILINGFSKAYAMTGWRLGYLAAPEPLVKACIALQGAVTSGTNTIAQRAALAALSLDPNELDTMRTTFNERRHLMITGFSDIPDLIVPEPKGAFYLMPDFSAYLDRQTPDGQPIEDTVSLCQYLLQEGRVAAVPGEAFGAPGTIRFSYATSNDIIKQVIHQVASTLAKLTR